MNTYRSQDNGKTKSFGFVDEQTAWIELSQDQRALIDVEDLGRVLQYSWQASAKKKIDDDFFYAKSYEAGPLHRFVMNAPEGYYVNHIDHNPLNCRKSNLRICTIAENLRARRPTKNSASRFKGVSYYKQIDRWIAQLWFEGERIYLGSFETEDEAAEAYDEGAVKYFKDFAVTNASLGLYEEKI
jgi:hypothetical protein